VDTLYTRVFKENTTPKSQILVVHGLGEHSGRFLGISKIMANENMLVHLLDLRGYGLSGGGRAQGSLNEHLRDIKNVIETQVDDQIPLFLMGHSMGAGILTLFVQANPSLNLAGVVLSSPFYRFPKGVKLDIVKRWAVAFLSRNTPVDMSDYYKELVMGTKISPNSLVRRKETLESIATDDLLTPFLCLRMVETLMDISMNLKEATKLV
jgi:acylglycerol lipase